MAEKWLDVYQRHFQHYFQKPFDIQVYHSGDLPSGASLSDASLQAAEAAAVADRRSMRGIGARRGLSRSLWHYVRFLFEPFLPAPKRAGPARAEESVGIKLATHDQAMPGFCIYASLGLADRLFRNEQDDFGEVILIADAPDKEVPRLFVRALFFILQHNIPLSSRFAIGLGADGEFARRYHKTALYFTRPVEEDDPLNEVVKEDTPGRVYQAYFITPEEDAYFEAHGADAFELRFWKQFSEPTSDEERFDRSVDKAEIEAQEATRLQAKRRAVRAYCLRRPSCV